jgi:flagellar biosynthetic protein FliP
VTARGLLPLLLALPSAAPALTFTLGGGAQGASLSVVPGPGGGAEAVQMAVLLTVLALVPAVLMLCTAFTRILVVLALLRQALGLQQVPPTPVLVGLAIFLSGLVMAPTLQRLDKEALTPMNQGKLPVAEALKKAQAPLRDFMLHQVREEDLAAFAASAMHSAPTGPDEVPTWVLAPAFLLSELRIAFKIGFLVFLPFLVVDLMVAAVLNAMGLMMLPPTLFSAPLKLLLFTLVDGWGLLAQQLIHSFH